VCVIGGAGFIGSHVVDHLIYSRDCKVLVLDNLISGLRKHVNPSADFVWFDIREDTEELTRLLSKYGAEYVFNYAAEPYVPECFERPLHFFDINAVAVLRVLNACQQAGVKGILQVSSAEIYGSCQGKISEDAPVAPHSTYGVSKLAADGLVQVRWREARVPAIAMRQFNCVGERETHEYVIPEIISQLHSLLQASRQVPLDDFVAEIWLGNDSTRDFQYAGDAAAMAVELLECGNFGEVYNMGSENTIEIYSLAREISALMGYRRLVIHQDPNKVRPWEIWHLQSNNAKLYNTIKRRPEIPLREALQRTIEYFHSNGNQWDW